MARALVVSTGGLQPEGDGAPIGPLASESPAEAQLAEGIPGLVREADDHGRQAFDHAAQDAVSTLLRPWNLLLEPLRAARYSYRGTGFDAVIRADGKVAYRSKSGIHLSVAQVVAAPELTSVRIGPGTPVPALSFGDPSVWRDKLQGRDTHAAERRMFLERTRSLRELLHQRAQRAVLQETDRELEQKLGRAVSAAYDREEQQRAIFGLWDTCADDEIGNLARARVERFVRTHCPPSEVCGFSPTDLDRLNARRRSRRRFDPYASETEPASAEAGHGDDR